MELSAVINFSLIYLCFSQFFSLFKYVLFFIEPTFRRCPFNFSQFFLPSFFLKTALIAQTYVFEISHNFLHFAFIENFRHPFPETSVEIITADFLIILQKR
ncbi:hypothetical protein EO92_04635 [Methanosarcina sp. 2.H.A.1B.4]|nr:hypothetical protein EO92_04635 [Methanosarcina sp. 2.H.A.1B.4]KKH48063.1 hypothetical protein EO93_00640 [Methanosarcina sp. 1.H.A.2.2]